MTRKERVMTAIRHQTPDQVPTGEIHIQPELCSRLLGKEYPLDYQHFERDAAVRTLLDMDVVNMGGMAGMGGGKHTGREAYCTNNLWADLCAG